MYQDQGQPLQAFQLLKKAAELLPDDPDLQLRSGQNLLLQGEYQDWLDALPENLADSALADALRAICDLDLSEIQDVDLPRGYGRD